MYSGGYDDIPLSVFKINVDILRSIITEICNYSLAESIFQNKFKITKFTPISKHDYRSTMKKYQPI